MIASESDLVKSGLSIFLKYTFKFLKNAWGNGVSIELCSEMLDEVVNMFKDIPKVLLFIETEHSQVLIDMLNKSILFLEAIVTRYVFKCSK